MGLTDGWSGGSFKCSLGTCIQKTSWMSTPFCLVFPLMRSFLKKSGSVQITGQEVFAIALNLMLWGCSSSRRRWLRWAGA